MSSNLLDYIGLGTILALALTGLALIIAWIKLGIEMLIEKTKV